MLEVSFHAAGLSSDATPVVVSAAGTVAVVDGWAKKLHVEENSTQFAPVGTVWDSATFAANTRASTYAGAGRIMEDSEPGPLPGRISRRLGAAVAAPTNPSRTIRRSLRMAQAIVTPDAFWLMIRAANTPVWFVAPAPERVIAT